jgi:hypothetical protein
MAKPIPAKGAQEGLSQQHSSPLETFQQVAKPLSVAHRTPDKRRFALQWAVRTGDNRLAYISRYKTFI